MHLVPLTPHEENGLRLHGLPIGKPSQLADAFRLGFRWSSQTPTPTATSPDQPASAPPTPSKLSVPRWSVSLLDSSSSLDQFVFRHTLPNPSVEEDFRRDLAAVVAEVLSMAAETCSKRTEVYRQDASLLTDSPLKPCVIAAEIQSLLGPLS